MYYKLDWTWINVGVFKDNGIENDGNCVCFGKFMLFLEFSTVLLIRIDSQFHPQIVVPSKIARASVYVKTKKRGGGGV